MKVGFSFSPGGLLLPYHLGVMDSLEYAGHLTPDTPVAGASAGAIAVACHGCGLPSATVLEATAALAEECAAAGGAKGRLIPALRRQMRRLVGPEQLERLATRPGTTGIAYQQIFPTRRAILQTQFTSTDDLIDAVCFSSTFPFFSDKWPVAFDQRSDRNDKAGSFFPRVFVDGFFCVPRDRLGCPDLKAIHPDLKNEVLVACLPAGSVGLTAVSSDRCISPNENALNHCNSPIQVTADDSNNDNSNTNDNSNADANINSSTTGVAKILQIAMEASDASTYFKVYEQGRADGEAWSIAFASELASNRMVYESEGFHPMN